MITLGIAGGIGVGKSYVSRFLFALHDVTVFNCDKGVKEILNQKEAIILRSNLMELCGPECYKDDLWNPNHIAKLAEDNKGILDAISSIVKPYLITRIEIFKDHNRKEEFCGIESALFGKSSDLRNMVDKMILVTAPLDIRISRVKERDPYRSDNEIITLLYNQITPYISYDYIITNGNNESIEVEEQIEMIINQLKLANK
jgi:dephospho-CoA kinase